jgi:uncharacterized repeat protein (TIGR04076 family)
VTDAADTFELYDLRVTIEEIRGRCTCDHQVGDAFELRGGKLSLPPGQGFCLYALQAAIPLLPAKQRPLHPNDWMSTDARVVCPDPLCGVVLRIDRLAPRTLRHSDVSAVPLRDPDDEPAESADDAGAGRLV